MPTRTPEAVAKLVDWQAQDARRSSHWIAGKLGRSGTWAQMLLKGGVKPTVIMADKIERLTGRAVLVEDWLPRGRP